MRCMTCLLYSLLNNIDAITEVADLHIRPAASGLNHSHSKNWFEQQVQTRRDQHLIGEEPALNLRTWSKASVNPGFFSFFSDLSGDTLLKQVR